MAWTHALDPVALNLGFFQIRWYGVMWVLAFFIVQYFLKKAVKDKELDLTPKQVEDVMLWLTLSIVVGARLFYVIFYNLSYYISNPLKVAAVWQGGLSFHGGLVGAILATWWVCKKYDIRFWKLAHVVVVPLSLAQALGRMGNFINGELYGRVSDVAWAVFFPGVEGARHPSQLYEVGYNLFIFLVLLKTKNNRLAVFMMLYSVFRFLVEFVRQPDVQLGMIGPLTMGQWLTIPVFLAGLYIYRKSL
ncbi:prolipoprotein diacylglyceryl transferase [Candidatus Woesearchaeota archaeon]|nr:prolipoprotein diacylglyceryl transferase [Candidatus Woesearchaeota archaeon]